MQNVVMPSGAALSSSERSFTVVLGKNLNDAAVLLTGGAASIGFHFTPPPGGKVAFEGTWDGIEWVSCTMREMGSNGYVSVTSTHEDYIGSVASFVQFRIRVITPGASPGEIKGKFSSMVCTLEGIEHGFPPHKIGADVKAATFIYSAITSNGTVALPVDPAKKLVVSDLHFTVSDANTLVIFSDGSQAESKNIFRGSFKPGSVSQYVPISFTLPHVFSGTARPLCFSQTGNATVDGVVHYYESE